MKHSNQPPLYFVLSLMLICGVLLKILLLPTASAMKSMSVPTQTFLPMLNQKAYPAPFVKRLYGVLQSDPQYLASDWQAGIRARTFELSWRNYEPQEGIWNSSYIAARKAEYQAMLDAGYLVVLDMGLQYPPEWARAIRPWVDQYGNIHDSQVNAVWSKLVREKIERYTARIFQDFGTDFLGVRLGSGGLIETMYPNNAAGYQFSYWAFDSEAMGSNPVPNWLPGQPSPAGEALKFYTWYVDHLIDTVNWQQNLVRRYYHGYLLQLFAGIGVRPAGWDTLIAHNLTPYKEIGVDAAERGVVIDRIIDGINNKDNVVIVSTSLGDGFATAPWLNELSSDPMVWSSAHWVAYNADRYSLLKWAENTGRDDSKNMQIVFDQVNAFDYDGLFWAFESDLHSGKYASLDQYAALVAKNQ